jgi:hypothetical protein
MNAIVISHDARQPRMSSRYFGSILAALLIAYITGDVSAAQVGASGGAKPQVSISLDKQRDIIERYFPDTAGGEERANQTLWLIMLTDGRVYLSGRTPFDVEQTRSEVMAALYPQIRYGERVTTEMRTLFGTEYTTEKGQPISATFAWLPDMPSSTPKTGSRNRSGKNRAETNEAAEVTLHAQFFRNGSPIAVLSRRTKLGETIPALTENRVRLETRVVEMSNDEVEVTLLVRVLGEPGGGIQIADPWEIVAKPAVRVSYGASVTIEQSVQYPDTAPDRWRVVIVPSRT